MPEDRGAVPEPAAERAGELIDALAEEAGAGRGDHPGDDELLDYRDGALDAPAEARLRDHLVGCRECTERLLDLDALSPDAAAEDVSELEAAALWRDVRLGVGTEDERRGPGRRPGMPAAPRTFQALAAVLALAVVGLGLWVGQLRREVDRLGASQANLPILYLDEPVRAVPGTAPEIAAPGAGERILLIVTPPAGELAEYRATLVAGGGREVWRGGGLRPSDTGTLRVLLPVRSLRPGSYELRLGGGTDGASRDLARYRFTVLPEARGSGS